MKRLGKFKTLTFASLTAVALAASIAMAQSSGVNRDSQQGTRGERHGHGEGWRGRGGHDWMLKGINLTDDQKAKMKQISQSFHERTQSLRQGLQAKRQELRQASEGGTFDEALATQKLTEAAGLEAKLMGEQFKMRQERLSVLTPEQKTQLEQKRAEFKAKRAEHRGRQVQ
jgi:protein CpxP